MALREDILNPIEGDSPSGPSLRYDPLYDQIKQARTEVSGPADPTDPDSPILIQRAADWERVAELAEEALANRTKDLDLAAWLTEALARVDGFSGLREGLHLLSDLQEQFWDELHPEIDDGDLEFRAAPLQRIGGAPVRESRGRDNLFEHFAGSAPMTRSGLGYRDFYVADLAGTEDDPDPEKQERRSALLGQDLPTLEVWEAAVRDTPKEFLRSVLKEIVACQEATNRIKAVVEERYVPVMGPGDAPGFAQLEGVLGASRRLAERIMKARLEMDPDPVPVDLPDEVDVDAPLASAPPGEADTGSGGEAGGTLPAEPGSRKDAMGRIAAAARFLRKENPKDPTPYALLRTVAWADLRAQAPTVDPKLLDPPPTALRTRLRALVLDEKWAQVLETAEEIMASPFGRGWLDVQRYALEATGNLGPDYDAVGDTIRAALRELLLDLPDLPRMSLMDDSPVANADTRAWIRNLGISRGTGSAEETDELSSGMPRRGGRDVLAAALERVRAGEPQKGIQLLMIEASQEKSSRARFLRRMEAAEIMLAHGHARVAHPLLREMLDQIENHKLEEWEAGETVAKALGLLYRSLQDAAVGDNERIAEDLYLRVCRLDPIQGITFGGPVRGS
jgi:type VI secretion system protein ImpA